MSFNRILGRAPDPSNRLEERTKENPNPSGGTASCLTQFFRNAMKPFCATAQGIYEGTSPFIRNVFCIAAIFAYPKAWHSPFKITFSLMFVHCAAYWFTVNIERKLPALNKVIRAYDNLLKNPSSRLSLCVNSSRLLVMSWNFPVKTPQEILKELSTLACLAFAVSYFSPGPITPATNEQESIKDILLRLRDQKDPKKVYYIDEAKQKEAWKKAVGDGSSFHLPYDRSVAIYLLLRALANKENEEPSNQDIKERITTEKRATLQELIEKYGYEEDQKKWNNSTFTFDINSVFCGLYDPNRDFLLELLGLCPEKFFSSKIVVTLVCLCESAILAEENDNTCILDISEKQAKHLRKVSALLRDKNALKGTHECIGTRLYCFLTFFIRTCKKKMKKKKKSECVFTKRLRSLFHGILEDFAANKATARMTAQDLVNRCPNTRVTAEKEGVLTIRKICEEVIENHGSFFTDPAV